MKLEAYRKMLVAAVRAGKLSPRKATRLYNQALEKSLDKTVDKQLDK